MTARALVVFIVLVFLFGHSSLAQTITPEPIALGPSEFPLPSAELDKQIAANDTAALRQHAWILWAGVTADSAQSFQGQKLPIWETWLSEQEAFAAPTTTMALTATTQRTLLFLTVPNQFRHAVQGPSRTLSVQSLLRNAPSRLLAGVKLSPDSAGFVAVSHRTPAQGGSDVFYSKVSDLDRLNAFFDQNKTPVADRKIVDFPAKAVDLKLVFIPVSATGLTAIPFWAGPQNSSSPTTPTPDTWTQCVAVDPTNSRSGTTDIDCNGKSVKAPIVPLASFYSIKLDSEAAVRVNATLGLTGVSSLAGGDFQVLVAMHLTTKEIANWTWQTFWWQNGQSPPNNIPGSVDGMLDQTRIKGPYRNYAMCISNSIVFPPTDPKGTPVVCYNPYLETGLPDGTDSNCMSCHARATYPGVNYPDTYLPNGWVDPADPTLFAGQTKTDLVWAVQTGAH
jgi:hypothetical protein